jgi:hypothetical protein
MNRYNLDWPHLDWPPQSFDHKRYMAVIKAFDTIFHSSQDVWAFSKELVTVLSLVKNQIFDFDDLVDKGVESGFLTEFDLWNLKDVVKHMFDDDYKIDFELPGRVDRKWQRIRKNILTFFDRVFQPHMRAGSSSKLNILLSKFILQRLITQNMLANIEVGTNELKASKKESPFFSFLGTNQQTLYRTDENLYPDRMGIKLGIITLILMRFPEFFSSFTEFLKFEEHLNKIDANNSVIDDVIHVLKHLKEGSRNFEEVNYLRSHPDFDPMTSTHSKIIDLCDFILKDRQLSSLVSLTKMFCDPKLLCLQRLSPEERENIFNIIRSVGVCMYPDITKSYLLTIQRRCRVNTRSGVANSA